MRETFEAIAGRIAPDVRARLFKAADPSDHGYVGRIFSRIPHGYAPRLAREYETRLTKQGRREANLYALSLKTDIFAELFTTDQLAFSATDDDITDAAEKAVRQTKERLMRSADEATQRAALQRLVERYRVSMPAFDDLPRIIARMTAARWWRKALRRRFRIVEAAAIRAGFVHRRAGVYVSDEAYRRHERQRRKNARLLETIEAENEVGDRFTLAELAEGNVSNPRIRRTEMMVRVRGMDEFSKLIGYEGLFITITCPSRMHSRMSVSGEPNPRYDGTAPDRAHTYLLRKVWAPVRAKFAREGIEYFGIRVAEPHHDATPHWHMLMFVRPDQKAALLEMLRSYVLREDGDEPGAQEHRFKVEIIDPAKGSATGYLAKYVSKNINGQDIGEDFESEEPATESAPRVEAWARLWRIRQFQFFGAPTVTPWRELRKLESVEEPLQALVGDYWRAADAGDFCAFMRLQNSPETRLAVLWEVRESATYPGETVKRIRGVIVPAAAGAVPVVTRQHEWRIRMKLNEQQAWKRLKGRLKKAALSAPWTRVNNCTPPDSTAFFRPSDVPYTASEYDIGGMGFYLPHGETDPRRAIVVRSHGNRIGSFKEQREGGGVRSGAGTATRHPELACRRIGCSEDTTAGKTRKKFLNESAGAAEAPACGVRRARDMD
jgi:hypothetical protein